MNHILTEECLIRGLCYSVASTTRAHCLMLSVKSGTAKTSRTFTLNNVDFANQYTQAVIAAVDFHGLDRDLVSRLVEMTICRFKAKYGIRLQKIEMIVAI